LILQHLSAYLFAAHFFFGSIAVLNASGLGFYLHYPRQIRIVVLEPGLDLLAWVLAAVGSSVLMAWSSRGRRWATVPVSISTLTIILGGLTLATASGDPLWQTVVMSLFTSGTAQLLWPLITREFVEMQRPSSLLVRALVYTLAFFVVVEVASATHQVLRAFDVYTAIGRMDAAIELQLSYASYPLLPWLYLAFLLSWAWAPLLWRIQKLNLFFSSTATTGVGENGSKLKRFGAGLSLLSDPRFVLALALAAFIGYYPYFQNPPWLVGTDGYWRYFDPLVRMNEVGTTGGFLQALRERHPLPLGLMYAVQLLLQTSPFDVVRHTPAVLVVAMGLASWWFIGARRRTEFGLLVFTLSAMSITTIVGYYASILANWMALIVWVAFFAYFSFRADRGIRAIDVLPLFALSVGLLLMHPWTWGMFAATVVLAILLAAVAERRRALRSVIVLASVVVLDALLALLSIMLIRTSEGWRILDAFELYTSGLRNPESLLVFWDALTRLTQVWASFFSPLYLAVALLGVICLKGSGLMRWQRRLILAWLCVAGVGSVLVSPLGVERGESQIWRVLFLTPFQLTAPFGLVWLLNLPNRIRTKHGVESGNNAPRSLWVWLGSLMLIGAAMALTPPWGRILSMVVLLPLATAFSLKKAQGWESKFVSAVMVLGFGLVSFNSTTRALGQLLLSPHSYRPL